MLGDYLKIIATAGIILNIYPISFFVAFCLLQNSCQSIFTLGHGPKPGTNRAKVIQNMHEAYLQLNHKDRSSLEKITNAIKKNWDTAKDNTFYRYAVWYATFYRFLGYKLRKREHSSDQDQLCVQAAFTPCFHAKTQLDDQAIGEAFNRVFTPTPSNTKSPYVFIRGYARNLQLYLKKHQTDKTNDTSYEWMLQVSNTIRLKARANYHTFVFSLLLCAFLLQQITLISLAGITLCVLGLYYYHTPNDYLQLTLGHDVRSPGSHVLSTSKETTDKVNYALGVILTNTIASALLMSLLFFTGLTPVNMLQLPIIIPFALISILDRALLLKNITLFSNRSDFVFRSKNTSVPLEDIPGITVCPPNIAVRLHSYVVRLCEYGAGHSY